MLVVSGRQLGGSLLDIALDFRNSLAIFRRRSPIKGMPIDDICTGTKWERYTGDAFAVAWYGDPITEAELPVEARSMVRISGSGAS